MENRALSVESILDQVAGGADKSMKGRDFCRTLESAVESGEKGLNGGKQMKYWVGGWMVFGCGFHYGASADLGFDWG